MKKLIGLVLALVCVLGLVGCTNYAQEHNAIFKGSRETYYKLDNGSWQVNGNTYKYRLEITGRMSRAATDTTFVYLSNLKTITFDQAWKAAGYSSNLNDYFAEKDAVLVDVILH